VGTNSKEECLLGFGGEGGEGGNSMKERKKIEITYILKTLHCEPNLSKDNGI
jgi:hypothetical protein